MNERDKPENQPDQSSGEQEKPPDPPRTYDEESRKLSEDPPSTREGGPSETKKD